MEEPAAGDGHLLKVIDPAQAVRVGDQVGEGVQVDQKARDQTGEKGGPLGGRDPAPQAGAPLVNGHRFPPVWGAVYIMSHSTL